MVRSKIRVRSVNQQSLHENAASGCGIAFYRRKACQHKEDREFETRVQNGDNKEMFILERMVLLLNLVDPARFLELIGCASDRGVAVLIACQF